MNIEHYEHRTSIKFMVIEKSIKNLTLGRFVTQGKTRITLTDSEKKRSPVQQCTLLLMFTCNKHSSV